MGFKITRGKFTDGALIDVFTGSTIAEIPSWDVENIIEDDYCVSTKKFHLGEPAEFSFELDDIQINNELLKKLTGDMPTNICDLSVPMLVQRRIHKKKRINKKWLKKYGYVVKHKTIKGCKITTDIDGNIEFASGYFDDKSNSQYMHIPRYGVTVI